MKPQSVALALGVIVAGLTATTLITPAQQPAPSQPTSQEDLQDRVDALDSHIQAVEEKSDRAALEKDYVERIQKQYESYYEKVLSTQMWTLGIMGFILLAVFALTASLGFSIFQRSIQDRLREASASLREEFTKKLGEELQDLKDSNAAQVKQLEGILVERIGDFEKNLEAKAEFQSHYSLGYNTAMGNLFSQAVNSFRSALVVYKAQKPRSVIPKSVGGLAVAQLFVAMRASDKENFTQNATKELANKLYTELDEELALAAVKVPELAPVLAKPNQAEATLSQQ